MKNQITLNLKEITMIMINLISVKLFFTYPKRLILNSGNAAWIQIIYVSLIMLGIFYITVFAYKRCGNKSILDLSDKIGGKPAKAFVGLLVIFVLFINVASTMRSYPDMVKMVLLPDTPNEMILLVYALVIAAAVYLGIDSIARIHAILVPIVLGIMLVFFVFLLPHAKIYNLYPLFGNGAGRIFGRGSVAIEFFDDILVLNILLPYIKNVSDAKKAGGRAIVICSFAAFLVMLMYGLIYPYPSSEKFIIPIYQLTRLLGIGDFFQRFEAFFEFVWSLAVFLYSSLYIAVICIVLRESFGLKYEKPLAVPVIAIITILSADIQNTQEMAEKHWYIIAITCITAFVLPCLMAIIYKIKMRNDV